MKQERDQVRKEINDLTADFEAKGGAWKQSEAAVKEYSLTRAALQGREAELTAQLDAKGKALAQSRRNLTSSNGRRRGRNGSSTGRLRTMRRFCGRHPNPNSM